MEAGYNSHPNRLSTESHYGADNLFNQNRPYRVLTPSSYYYTSPPPVTPRPRGYDRPYIISSPSSFYVSPPPVTPRPKGDTAPHIPPEICAEDSLARKLSTLTNALNQGKPIRVEDLMSLRTDNESDVKVVQLLGELHAELRLTANSRSSGLDSHVPMLNPPPLDTNTAHSGNFDAHAVYAGDDAMSSGRWSQVATAGVRTALLALMSRYGLETCNPSPVITRPPD